LTQAHVNLRKIYINLENQCATVSVRMMRTQNKYETDDDDDGGDM